MNHQELMQLILTTPPDEWISDIDEGVAVCRRDLNVRLAADKESEREFCEPWTQKYPDPNAHLIEYVLWYGASPIERFPLIAVDGYRAYLPLPKLKTMEITRLQFVIACAINVGSPYLDYFVRYVRRFPIVDSPQAA